MNDNAIQKTETNTLMASLKQALAEAANVATDIGGSLTVTTSGVFANLQQAMSPDVVEGRVEAGSWKITDGEDVFYTPVLAGFLVDIIGAKGQASTANPPVRKLFYPLDRSGNAMRAVYGDVGPHCGSINGRSPDPRFLESQVIAKAGGLIDMRVETDMMEVQDGFRKDAVARVTRLVPIHENGCGACQLGDWIRPLDGSKAMPPICEQVFRALVWVYGIEGDRAEEWEPKMVIIEGRGAAQRTFYAVGRDKQFQGQLKAPALYDEAFVEKDFGSTYGVDMGDSGVAVFPLVVAAVAVSGDAGTYYVPRWANTANAYRKAVQRDTDMAQTFMQIVQTIANARFINGPDHKDHKGYQAAISRLLNNTIIAGESEWMVMLQEFLTTTFKEYWEKDADNQPKGRSALRQPMEPVDTPAPVFGGPAPTVAEAAPAIDVPTFPKFVGSTMTQEPATDVVIEVDDENTPWDA